MRKLSLLFSLIVFAAGGLWSQQASTPKPDQPAPPPIVRDPHSTQADLAVPLCPNKFDDSISTDGIAHLPDRDVTPPALKHSVNAQFSDEARHQKRKGRITHFEAILSLVVDTDGEPQNICLMQSAGFGLDGKAAEAVQQYRFGPATKNGTPVASRISVVMVFHNY
ncbi:MAG: energy transducer TonB [Terracidiphilus sp.]